MTKLDLAFVRAQFPAFSVPDLADKAFFENAGGSYACGPVIDRLTRFYRERKVQPYAPYAAATAGGEEMDEARARLAAMMGVKTHELSFGPSTTANTYVLAQAFRHWLKPGDAIVVTDQDHEANSGPWRRLAEEGIEIREWKIDPATGHLDPSRLEGLLADGKVRLLCFPHCSNVVAEINPVAEIVALAHGAGAVTCVDGVSYAPHGVPDVGGAWRGYLPVFRLQGLWPPSGHHGDPRGSGDAAAQPGALVQRRDALQAVHARRAGSRADSGLRRDGRLFRCVPCPSLRGRRRSAPAGRAGPRPDARP